MVKPAGIHQGRLRPSLRESPASVIYTLRTGANIPQAANRCLCNIEHFADAVLSRMLQAPHSSQIFTGAYGFRPCEYGEGRPLFSRCFRIATA
jgi:hypothetical protein